MPRPLTLRNVTNLTNVVVWVRTTRGVVHRIKFVDGWDARLGYLRLTAHRLAEAVGFEEV
jgi:hypothetical protein